MKKEFFYTFILLPICTILFFSLLPLILFVFGIYILFKSKSTDNEKIIGAKMAVSIVLIFIFLSVYIKLQPWFIYNVLNPVEKVFNPISKWLEVHSFWFVIILVSIMLILGFYEHWKENYKNIKK